MLCVTVVEITYGSNAISERTRLKNFQTRFTVGHAVAGAPGIFILVAQRVLGQKSPSAVHCFIHGKGLKQFADIV